MGFWDAEETGAERAARIRGENQAAQHARMRNSKEEDHEKALHAQWSKENIAYKRAEYQADLAAWKKDPNGYERRYDSPADVRDMPGEPFFPIRRDYVPSEPEASGDTPLIVKLIGGAILLFVVLPALFKMAIPVIGGIIQTIWLIVLSLAGLLTVVWLILKLTAGEDPAKLQRAQLFNPLRIGKVIYQVIREHLAERAARKNVER